MKNALAMAVGALLWVEVPAAAAQSSSAAIDLVQGPFAPLSGTTLDGPERFERPSALPENPPVSTTCFPLMAQGDQQVLAWLSAAASADGRVFVRRCVDGDVPPDPRVAGVRRGGEALEWEEATLALGADGLRVTSLALPDWSFFSNPSFCQSAVAYWSMRGTDLFAQVYDLTERRVLESRPRGVVYLVSDESDALEAPVWEANCSRVAFAARRLGSRVVVISLD
jgi:hypothetical protein